MFDGIALGVEDAVEVPVALEVGVGVVELRFPFGFEITSPGLSAHFPPSLVLSSLRQVSFAP